MDQANILQNLQEEIIRRVPIHTICGCAFECNVVVVLWCDQDKCYLDHQHQCLWNRYRSCLPHILSHICSQEAEGEWLVQISLIQLVSCILSFLVWLRYTCATLADFYAELDSAGKCSVWVDVGSHYLPSKWNQTRRRSWMDLCCV